MLLSDQPIWNTPQHRDWISSLTTSIPRNQRDQEEIFLESYEKGEEIRLDVGEVWQVYRGVMQLSKISARGEETILGWITPNHVFGNLYNHDVVYRLVALADVYVRKFSIQEIQQSPSITCALVSEFSYRSIQSQKLLAVNTLRRVEERLWHLLLMLTEEMGYPTEDGIRLTARFTHQNLAKVIFTTRVTVTRILGDFQSRGWIEFDKYRHLIIKTSAPKAINH